MRQDATDDGRLVDERKQSQPPGTPRARQDVEAKAALHQPGPVSIARAPSGLVPSLVSLTVRLGHNGPPVGRPRREHAVIEHQVDPRPRHQRGQTFEQLDRIEDEVRRAVRPSAAQLERDGAVGQLLKPVLPDCRPDGRVLAFSERREGGTFNLWTLPLSGPAGPAVFRRTDFGEFGLRFSPDGRRILFLSNRSGRTEVYVSLASGGSETLVSQGGAEMACWSPDGREVLYVSSDRRLMGAPVLQTGAALQAGAATTRFAISGKRWLAFDASRDGTNLLALILENNADEQPLTALLHANAR
jgi:hypothetical protein